ncbi:hypothetical protein ACWD4O_48105 [Streptomyces sp. NPDC002623]
MRTGDSAPWATTVFGLSDLALVTVSVFWALFLGMTTAAVPEGPDGAYEEGPEVLFVNGLLLGVPVLIAALVVGLVEPTWLGPAGSAGTWLGRSLSWGERVTWLLTLGLLAALSLVATAMNVRKRLARPTSSHQPELGSDFQVYVENELPVAVHVAGPESVREPVTVMRPPFGNGRASRGPRSYGGRE